MSENHNFELSMKGATEKTIQEIASNLEKCCLMVVASAKEKCPVDEGILRASITHEVKVKEKELVGVVGSNLEYAPYVHYGTGIYAKDGKGRKTPWLWQGHSKKYKGWHLTRGQKPQPFLEEAINENKDKISKVLSGK